jgi:dolichyl-phosphate-mannose-protein mannosyltransferase
VSLGQIAGNRGTASRRFSLQRTAAWVLEHWIVVTAFSWLGCGALYLTLPPSPDQFQHAYLGWRLLDGDIPYRDFIDVNWPGVMAVHALATWLFGAHLWSWRALDFALFAASAVCLSDLVRRASGEEARRFCLVIAPGAYVGASYWVVGQHDMTAAQFLVAALWFHVLGYEKRSGWYQIGTGICIGLAMLNKPTAGIIGMLLPLHGFWMRAPVRLIARHTAAAGVAAVATILLSLAALLARGASLREVLDATSTYHAATQYSGEQTAIQLLGWLLQFHYEYMPALAAGTIPAATWIFTRGRRSTAATAVVVLWLAGCLSYFFQWRGLGYHLSACFLAAIGGVAISAAIAFRNINDSGGHVATRLLVALTCLAILGIGVRLGASYRSVPAMLFGSHAPHLSRYSASDELSFADVDQLVSKLKALPGNDCVLLVGDASSINYLAQRRMPTRFYYYHALANAPEGMPFAERWFELWEADLRSAQCNLTLISRTVASGWLQGAGRPAAALREFLHRYKLVGAVASGGVAVYERK